MLIAYAQKPPLNSYADISSGARGLNFGPSLQLHPCFVNVSSKGPDKPICICTCSPEPLLLSNVTITKISCVGVFIYLQDKGL